MYVMKMCELLGVRLEESFLTNDGNYYMIEEDGSLFRRNLETNGWQCENVDWVKFISGEIKPVWKPSVYESYYTITLGTKSLVTCYTWDNHEVDQIKLEQNLVFKTEKEARRKANEILKVLKANRRGE